MKSPKEKGDNPTQELKVSVPLTPEIRNEIDLAATQNAGPTDSVTIASDSSADEDTMDESPELEHLDVSQPAPGESPMLQYEETVDPTNYMEDPNSESSEDEHEVQPSQMLTQVENITRDTEIDGDERDQPDPFVGLSSSQGVVTGFSEFSQAMAEHRPLSMRQTIGIYNTPQRETPQVNMTTYQLADEQIRREVMKSPKDVCDFLGNIKYNYQAVAREEDMRKLEEYSRKALTILSNLDASMSALLHFYPTTQDPDEKLMRGLFRTTQGLQALTEIHILSLHQVVTHRRDTAINAKLRSKTAPVDISEDHLSRLRYQPILEQQHLFDPEVVKAIQKERDASQEKQAQVAVFAELAARRASNAVFQHPPTPGRPNKRFPPPTATVSVNPDKKMKKHSTNSQQGMPGQGAMQASTPKQSPSATAAHAQQSR